MTGTRPSAVGPISRSKLPPFETASTSRWINAVADLWKPFQNPVQGADFAVVVFSWEGDRGSEQRQGEG
jgi:hypothetical protein